QTECWMAVNNTVAQSVEDVGVGAGLRNLRVPTMTLTLLSQDVTDTGSASKLLFKTLHYTETLANVASAGYTKRSAKTRNNAMRIHALHQSRDGESSRQDDPSTPFSL
ncbi:hypothetical protein KIPB_013119, partial [Kipferlia bialata]